jgi:hypothetical protein
MPLSSVVSMSGCVWSVVWIVWGERVIGLSCGRSWSGALLGDSFETLNEPFEDMGSMKRERGGAEHIASCHCWQ